MATPKVFFSDLTDAPTSGWEQSATKGAAVSIWGLNFGATRGTSYVTVGGVDLVWSSDYAEWGVVDEPGPGEDPNDVYSSARGLERITFWLRSAMSLGATTITVTTSEGTSESIPFYCRAIGDNKIYFISRDGNDGNNGEFAEQGAGSDGPWLLASKVRTILAGDVAYFRTGIWTEDDQFGCVIGFVGTNHNNGAENNSISIASYPAEVAQLGGAYVLCHVYDDQLHYWTFSKFLFRSTSGNLRWGTGGSLLSSSSHNRFIGLDASTNSNIILEFTGAGGGQSYLTLYGNHLHDAGVSARGDRGGSAYGLYFDGYGWHDYIYIGWNEISYQSNGRGIQIYGHVNTDWIDNVYIHDNYIHHNAYQAAVLGGGDGGTYEFLREVYFYNNVLALNGNTEWIEPGSHGPRGAFPHLILSNNIGGEYYIYNNALYIGDEGEIQIAGDPEIVEIKNNIIYGKPSNLYYEIGGGVDLSVLDGAKNCYFDGLGGIPGWDDSTLEVDPQFVDPDAGDFTLENTSPCRDAGVVLSLPPAADHTIARDYDGIQRPQGSAYDIGAHEYFTGSVSSSSSSSSSTSQSSSSSSQSSSSSSSQSSSSGSVSSSSSSESVSSSSLSSESISSSSSSESVSSSSSSLSVSSSSSSESISSSSSSLSVSISSSSESVSSSSESSSSTSSSSESVSSSSESISSSSSSSESVSSSSSSQSSSSSSLSSTSESSSSISSSSTSESSSSSAPVEAGLPKWIDSLARAIYNRFVGNSSLVAALGGATGRHKYRFYHKRGPEKPEFPYVVYFILGGQKEDTFKEEGEIIEAQFNIYDHDPNSPDDDATVNDIYDKVDTLYDKCRMDIQGYHHIYMLRGAMIPVPVTDDTQQITALYEVMVQSSSSSMAA